ncbi:MAG: TatD family hydrolase [Casimicrobiaceae bacterium]|nr:TatD family hydrolase [Casimicrobiaceae bacterium]MCX8099120.1 TatD family hydrolase [Casimicrobiaceae bacterium]MDW8312187.1 TatD family hydrolase [Burkholderiales bacterium]
MFVDSHCHLDFPEFAGETEALLDRMAEARVTHALVISVTLEDWPRVHALACSYENLFATVGVHPDYEDSAEPTLEDLTQRARQAKVVAIGETGLDYYRKGGNLEWQRERFRRHIRAAREVGLPLVVHCREAAEDTLRILEEEGAASVGGVMHCFTERWEVAEAAMALGFYISFSGIVSFRNARQLHEVACRVPLERMLIETDSPYLAPVPHRGKRNEPAYLPHVAEAIAALRGIPVESVATATRENFAQLFKVRL